MKNYRSILILVWMADTYVQDFIEKSSMPFIIIYRIKAGLCCQNRSINIVIKQPQEAGLRW